jgi:hypothetical protein
MTIDQLRKASALALTALPVIAVAAALALADLPNPLPSHWNVHGEPDRTMALATFTVMSLAVTGGAAIAAFGFARGERPRYGIAVCAFAAYLVGALTVLTASLASGAATAEQVRLPAVGLIVALGVPLLGLALTAAIWPSSGPAAEVDRSAAELPRLDIGENERVVYVTQIRSRAFALLAVACALIGLIVALTVDVLVGASLLAVTAAALVLQQATIRIDASGLRIGFGPWLRIRIPLTDIRQAAPEQIQPMQWGGWGYRAMTPGRRALILRAGPGLVLDLTNGSRFAVTLDDPDEAAAVLNGLVSRIRQS